VFGGMDVDNGSGHYEQQKMDQPFQKKLHKRERVETGLCMSISCNTVLLLDAPGAISRGFEAIIQVCALDREKNTV
jgi:hypothetical protein